MPNAKKNGLHPPHEPEVIISGIHLSLTDALKNIAREKIQRLLRHEDRIDRLRLDLSYHGNGMQPPTFTARGHIEMRGPDLVASVETDDLHRSLDEVVDKLDRMIRRRARYSKVKRKHVHPIDIPAVIPKESTP